MTIKEALSNFVQTFASFSTIAKICLLIGSAMCIMTIVCLAYGAYNGYFDNGVNSLFWITLGSFFLSIIMLAVGCYHLQLTTLIAILMGYILILFTTMLGFS